MPTSQSHTPYWLKPLIRWAFSLQRLGKKIAAPGKAPGSQERPVNVSSNTVPREEKPFAVGRGNWTQLGRTRAARWNSTRPGQQAWQECNVYLV